MRALTTKLRRQDGIALPMVMGVMALTAVLSTTALAVSMQGTQESAKDRDAKRAAAAAHAAVEYAVLTTTTVQPQPNQCVAGGAVGQQNGECPEYIVPEADPMRLGNGAEMRYVVSLPGSAHCPAAAADEPDVRCITGIGEVNGVVRRARIATTANPVFAPFRGAGIKAKDRVEMKNAGEWNTDIGTNGAFIAGNGVSLNGSLKLGPNSPPGVYGNGGGPSGGESRVPEWQFEEIDFLPSLTNQNGLLPPSVYTNVMPNPRRFYMGNNVDYTFPVVPGGKQIYNFCSFTMTNNNELRVPLGQTVQIFIDSPARPGSNCGTASGRFDVDNSAVLNKPYVPQQKVTQLQFYVYGTGGNDTVDEPDVYMKNGTEFWGTIYAPNSIVYQKNAASFTGAVVGREIEFKNSTEFFSDANTENIGFPGQEGANRRTWTECSPVPTVQGDPESGCQ